MLFEFWAQLTRFHFLPNENSVKTEQEKRNETKSTTATTATKKAETKAQENILGDTAACDIKTPMAKLAAH